MFFFAPGQSISRILSNRNDPVKDHLCLEDHLSRLTVTRQFQQSTRNSREASSFPSPKGHCSCLTLLPVRVTWPWYYYRRRWSLTPPFHPYSPAIRSGRSGFYSTHCQLEVTFERLFSVALSERLLSPGRYPAPCSAECGLSSIRTYVRAAILRPTWGDFMILV